MTHDLEKILCMAPAPLLVVDETGTVLWANAEAERLLEDVTDNLCGAPLSRLLPISDMDAIVREDDDSDTSQPASRILDVSSDARGPRYVEVRATVWMTAAGQARRTISMCDVTDRWLAEQQNRVTMQRWEHALVGANIGVFELDIMTGRSIVSATWKTLMGFAADEDVDGQAEWLSRIHPEDLPAVQAADRDCIDGRAQRSITEYRLRSRDGHEWRWMRSDAVAALRDESSRALRLIGAQTDITEKKAVDNLLRQQNALFQAVFENSPIAKAIVSLDGRWQWVNPALCNFLGCSEAELLETDFQSVTHPDDVGADVKMANDLVSGRKSSYRMEKRYVRADGSVVWGLLNRAIVREKRGQPPYFISQIVDITEQRKIIEMKSEFVATVSHELRTPLTSILAALGLLASSDPETLTEEAKRLVSIARMNGEHLDHLVRGILDFEKLSTRERTPMIGSYRLAALLEQAILANSATVERFGAQHILENVDPVLTCDVDPQWFQEIMANLLSNASKFSLEGPPITIRADGLAGHVRISVTNKGPDIAEGFRPEIFKPFSQAEPSSTRRHGGTGLGLSICKQLVEQMSGEIGYQSAGGTTVFWFTVPAVGIDADGASPKRRR